jgi:hypothetical protein
LRSSRELLSWPATAFGIFLLTRPFLLRLSAGQRWSAQLIDDIHGHRVSVLQIFVLRVLPMVKGK